MRLMLEVHMTVELVDEQALAAAVEDRLAQLPAEDRLEFASARTDLAEALQLLVDPAVLLVGTGLESTSHSAITGPDPDDEQDR